MPPALAQCGTPALTPNAHNHRRYFLSLLVSTLFLTALHLGVSIQLIVAYHEDDGSVESRGKRLFERSGFCHALVDFLKAVMCVLLPEQSKIGTMAT